MPQMAPISWHLLFIYFTIVFLLFCSINFYSYMTSSPSSAELSNLGLNSMIEIYFPYTTHQQFLIFLLID